MQPAPPLGSVVKVVGVADCCVAGPGPGSVELWSCGAVELWSCGAVELGCSILVEECQLQPGQG